MKTRTSTDLKEQNEIRGRGMLSCSKCGHEWIVVDHETKVQVWESEDEFHE